MSKSKHLLMSVSRCTNNLKKNPLKGYYRPCKIILSSYHRMILKTPLLKPTQPHPAIPIITALKSLNNFFVLFCVLVHIIFLVASQRIPVSYSDWEYHPGFLCFLGGEAEGCYYKRQVFHHQSFFNKPFRPASRSSLSQDSHLFHTHIESSAQFSSNHRLPHTWLVLYTAKYTFSHRNDSLPVNSPDNHPRDIFHTQL